MWELEQMENSKRQPSVDEFLALPDRNMQKYILSVWRHLPQTVEVKKVDNDEKFGMYYIIKGLGVGVNSFYRKDSLTQWIVYDKVTKKVKKSNCVDQLRMPFIEHFFRYPALIAKFVDRMQPTLIKKIIEGKLHTLRDLMTYQRSYVLRRKDIDPETVYKFKIKGCERLLSMFENPNLLRDIEGDKLREIGADLPETFVWGIPFLLTKEDIDNNNVKQLTDEWFKKEGERYDSFTRQRDAENGNTVGTNHDRKGASDTCHISK